MSLCNNGCLSDITVVDRGSAVYADRNIVDGRAGVVGDGDVQQDVFARLRNAVVVAGRVADRERARKNSVRKVKCLGDGGR